MDESRATGCLVYLGARPHDEVAGYMSAADVLVLPSHREGLPTVLVEAGSLGLPVIASAVGGIPALLGEDRGAILPAVTSEAIADCAGRVRGEPVSSDRRRGEAANARPRRTRRRRERRTVARRICVDDGRAATVMTAAGRQWKLSFENVTPAGFFPWLL